MSKNTYFKIIHGTCQLLCSCTLAITCFGSLVYAQNVEQNENGDGLGYSADCTEVSVDYEDDPTLTQEEKTALMEQAFFRSLSKFDACQDALTKTSSTSSGGGGSVTGGNSDATSAMTGTETSNAVAGIDAAASTASSDMSGAEASVSTNQSQNASSTAGDDEPAAEPGAQSSTGGQVIDMDNGKIPDDIPSVDNDSVLEAQIRQAATDETDPDLKAKLWNEYRRYKGLPQVN